MSSEDSCQRIQQDLDLLEIWVERWQMEIKQANYEICIWTSQMNGESTVSGSRPSDY